MGGSDNPAASQDLVQQTRTFLEAVFEDFEARFMASVSDDLIFTVTGSSPLAGRTTSKEEHIRDVLTPLVERTVNRAEAKRTVNRIMVDGSSAPEDGCLWAAVDFSTEGVNGTNGTDFSMRYCWLIKVEHACRIVEVVGFPDSAKVTALLQ